jgi:hypothetical protein
MTRNEVRNDYFNWIIELVCGDIFSRKNSYRKLLSHLHNTEFIWMILRDENRADDGIDLRYRFAREVAHEDLIESIMDDLSGPCSVLEMMVALSIRCEETIMDDTDYGDRTRQWFWGMITNLGLGSMNDLNFDRRVADNIINRFLNRSYEPDGKGGLFTVRNCEQDLRSVEIWCQLLWYLDNMYEGIT